jgi:Ti-type conjugative transfer relaxase TraA
MTPFKGGRKSKSGRRTGLGSSFVGLVDYLEKGSREHPNLERVEWTSTRNLDTDDPAEASRLMQYAASDNPRVKLPVYHFGLSLAEGEHLTQEQWEVIAGRVLARMGLADHQVVLIAHNDTPREHVHFVVNRVDDDGHPWSPFRDMVKAHEAIRPIEIEYGLTRLGRDQAPPDLSAGAYREALRTGVQPLADRVREQAGPVFARATGWQDLEAGLAQLGYRLERAERGAGVVVTDGSRRASLSRVDRNLSGPKLAARFGETFRDHRQRHPEPPQVQRPAARPELAPLRGETDSERARALVERVTATRATFTRADLDRAAFYEPASKALVARALEKRAFDWGEIADMGKDASGVTRFASADYLRDETQMFRAAQDLASRQRLRLDPGQVGRALDRAPRLSAEQRAAVLHATTGPDLALVVGRAGAGKTTAAATLAAAYRDAGHDLRGAALAGKAADTLQQETRIPSRTLHSWEHAWGRNQDLLHARSVLVIDEAGMVDARQLGRVLDRAARAGAKVVLLGDPDQLKPIGPGDGYRGLLEQHPAARLETVRRQAEPWQRQASEDLAGGRVSTALDAYQQAGRLHLADTRAAARAALLDQHRADRAAAPDGSQLVLAYRNDDVRQLNADLRAARQAAGELGPGVTIAGADYAPGDRLVFLQNDNRGLAVANLAPHDRRGAGVKNGTLGTLESVAETRFTARLDDGRRVAWDPAQYQHFAHGYAVTIHKSQGATIDRTYVLADPMMNRNASYVALTRHRQGVQLHADRETFADRDHLDRALSRAPRKDLARDYGLAAIERHAARLQPLAVRLDGLQREHQKLGIAHRAHQVAKDETRSLGDWRARLEQAAARVYADPAPALARLTADPDAVPRLIAGQAHAYGQLHGRPASRFRRADRLHQAAQQAVPALRANLSSYRATEQAVAHAHQFAASFSSDSPPRLAERLHQLNQAIQGVRQAMQAPEKAMQAAVREMTLKGAKLALAALPRPLQLPVELAIRAVERVLDRGLGLGR